MVPRWFDKRPHRSNADTIATLQDTLVAAAEVALDITGTVRSIANDLRKGVQTSLSADTPRLAAGFGPAVVEMALIDSVCRLYGLSFLQAARADLFGLSEDAPADLEPDAVRKALQAIQPRRSIAVRHTVGYGAPLTPDEGADQAPDGLPVALTDVIASTGIRAFKIKLQGVVEKDFARLQQIAALLDPMVRYTATLDANEQYDEGGFAELVDRYLSHPALARFRQNVAFFEQPFPRETALAPRNRPLDFGVPIVIDESDDHEDALPQAWMNGWAGTSVKSCKGVLRALVNLARCKQRQAHGQVAVLSAEDLTCQPGLCWQQDTMMAACVGAAHVERNGHHFAGGMQGASGAEQSAFCKAHPTLYRPSPTGPQLIITDGLVDISSLAGAGFASAPMCAEFSRASARGFPLQNTTGGSPRHYQET